MKHPKDPILDSNARGFWAEQFAERWLVRQGLVAHTRNFHRRMGELDLVLRDEANNRWVFVEVKYRKRNAQVSGVECITARKRKHLWRTASLFLQRNNDHTSEARIDVLIVTPQGNLASEGAEQDSSCACYSQDGHRQQIVHGHRLTWIKNAIDGDCQ